jgi:hypothetical protein
VWRRPLPCDARPHARFESDARAHYLEVNVRSWQILLQKSVEGCVEQ